MASGSGAGDSGSGGSGADDVRRRIREAVPAGTFRETNRAIQAVMQQQQQPAVPQPIIPRAVVPWDRVAAHRRLYEVYFSQQSRFGDTMFRRHFRMRRSLFLRIVGALERRYEYFRMREDAIVKPDHTPLQKFTAALSQSGSWHTEEWKNCPTAWKVMYTTGFKGKNSTIILKVVADYRLWIWHAYFGVARSNNDLNVLNSSLLFNDQCMGVGLAVSFVANDNQHNMGYYLADEIYPMWSVFVKTIRNVTEERKIYFASRQEAAHKDVERTFGVLQA